MKKLSEKDKNKLSLAPVLVFSAFAMIMVIASAFNENKEMSDKIKNMEAIEHVEVSEEIIEEEEEPASIEGVEEESAPEELNMRDWVLNEAEKAGLNASEVDCIVKNESGWNQWASGWNTNGTTDSGLFQINSIHKGTISIEDRFDYKKATAWAINKRLHDGNWSAWVASKKCGL